MSDDNDPRVQDDPHARLIHYLDQHCATVPILAKVFAAEWTALRTEGVGSFAAAVLVGTRWSANL